MVEPKITVIVTTKNRPDFLFRCLTAIRLQNFKEFECIVVGDFCDYSQAVMEDFKDDDRFIYHANRTIKQKNIGATGKNIAIGMSRTNYLCYCDDDNILLPNHVEVIYKELSTGIDLVFTEFMEVFYGETPEYIILNRELYSRGTPDFRCKLGKKDLISMGHTKRLAIKAGMWKPMEEVGYNEDGYIIDYMAPLANGVSRPHIITAIYNEHRNEHKYEAYEDIYLKSLIKTKAKGGTYVYPELVEKLKAWQYSLPV